jgi:hypothetical protein
VDNTHFCGEQAEEEEEVDNTHFCGEQAEEEEEVDNTHFCGEQAEEEEEVDNTHFCGEQAEEEEEVDNTHFCGEQAEEEVDIFSSNSLSPPLPLFPPFIFSFYFRFRLGILSRSLQMFFWNLFYSISHVLGFSTILEPI